MRVEHADPSHRLVLLSALAFAIAACGEPPNYSVTEHSRPFVALNARAKGQAPAVSTNLDYSRLLAARSEPQNWLTYYGAYDGQRYSSLAQINSGNVRQLRPAWVYQNPLIGVPANPATFAMESTPIVVDGVMFASGPDGFVWAIDAASGASLWQYHHAVPIDVPLCCGNVNRGVAVVKGKVLFVTPNGHLIALDATTGKPV
jgi:alcohol dehydrogenase (cytochrome c)